MTVRCQVGDWVRVLERRISPVLEQEAPELAAHQRSWASCGIDSTAVFVAFEPPLDMSEPFVPARAELA